MAFNEPYTHAREQLDDYLVFLKLLVRGYIERHAHRLGGTKDVYTDECVGRDEVLHELGLEASYEDAAPRWFEHLGHQLDAKMGEQQRLIEMRLARSMHTDPPPRLPIEELRARLKLDRVTLMLLITALAPCLSPGLKRLYIFTWADFTHKQPTTSFLADLLAPLGVDPEDTLEYFTAGHVLFDYHLVELHHHEAWQGETPLAHQLVSVPERVISYLRGWRMQAPDLEGCMLHTQGIDLDQLTLDPKARQQVMSALRHPSFRIAMVGPSGVGRRSLLCALARQQGHHVLEVNVGEILNALPERARRDDVKKIFAQVLREALLSDAHVLLRMDQLERSTHADALRRHAPSLQRFLKSYSGGIAVTSSAPLPLLRDLFEHLPEVRFEMPVPDAQITFWSQTLREHLDEPQAHAIAEHVAGSYNVTPGAIVRAVDGTIAQAGYLRGRQARSPRDVLTSPALLQTLRQHKRHNLGWLADAYSVSLSLDDVVLSANSRALLEDIKDHARHGPTVFDTWGFKQNSPSGRGLVVLFSGPPGTGKTLVAGILANELGKHLYRIDLSRVVDKYVGETEKNLGYIFDEAERAQAMLLFDEADSLFSKRTDVKSSNDKYSNMEVNFLLQRLDAFEGVAVLTTNLAAGLDEAMHRRVRVKVAFPIPESEERAALWRKLLPPKAPLSRDINFEALGEGFEMAGGHIKNAVLAASVRAAACQEPVSMDMLWDAALHEYKEMGNLSPLRPHDLDDDFM